MTKKLISNQSATPPSWAPTDRTIHRTFNTGTFDRGLAFVNDIGRLAAAVNHHPDIILTYPTVIVTLMTHNQGLVTDLDRQLAAQIDALWADKYSHQEYFS